MDVYSILLNIIVILFPVLIYLVFSCYNVFIYKKIEKIVFIITICTSLYSSLLLNTINEDGNLLLLFCNIPILICYFKKERNLGIVFSIIVVVISYYMYGANIWITGIKYLLYFVIYILLYSKKKFQAIFLEIIAIVQAFFISFEYFFNTNGSFKEILNLLLCAFVIYAITFVCLYLFKLADNISSLHQMVSEADRENKLKNALFKMTHEVKNPIAVCKGYLDMMNLDNRDKSEKYIYIIKSEISRCLNIMNEFMEFNKVKINKEIFDMSLLMNDIYESFNVLITDKKINFIYDNKYDDIYLWGDYDRLKQVFVNILKNSVEAMDSGGIIKIVVKVENKKVKILITDNGIGMTKEELSNLKEMFFTTKKQGTGLGVSLSNEIILAHNGELNYESVKNEGTMCTVILPI